MLIQAFAISMDQVTDVVTMFHNHLKDKIVTIEVSEMRNVNEGYYRVVEFSTPEAALKDVDINIDENMDNVGIYYNSGKKIFIRVYKNAKVDPNAYAQRIQDDYQDAPKT